MGWGGHVGFALSWLLLLILLGVVSSILPMFSPVASPPALSLPIFLLVSSRLPSFPHPHPHRHLPCPPAPQTGLRRVPGQGFAGVSLWWEQLVKGVPPSRSLLRRSQEIIRDKQEPVSAKETGGAGGTGGDSSVPRASPGSRGDRSSTLPVSEGLGRGGQPLSSAGAGFILGVN